MPNNAQLVAVGVYAIFCGALYVTMRRRMQTTKPCHCHDKTSVPTLQWLPYVADSSEVRIDVA